MALTLDAGALIAIDRADRSVHAMLKEATTRGHVVTVPAPVVGQVWRDGSRQTRLARAIDGCRVEPTSHEDARAAGVLLGRAGRSDVIDALVVLSAARRGDEVLTSDPAELSALANAAGTRIQLTLV